MAASVHFGGPKITFDRIFLPFQINTQLFFLISSQNGCRRKDTVQAHSPEEMLGLLFLYIIYTNETREHQRHHRRRKRWTTRTVRRRGRIVCEQRPVISSGRWVHKRWIEGWGPISHTMRSTNLHVTCN